MDTFLEGLFSPTFNGADLWALAISVGLILRMAIPLDQADERSTDE
ncbi:hypothetical protein [Glutamicibacter arilaitensis]